MDKYLAILKEHAEKAAHGPWYINDDNASVFSPDPDTNGVLIVADVYAEADREYISAMSPDTTIGLIEKIDRLEKEKLWLVGLLNLVCLGMGCNDCRLNGYCYRETGATGFSEAAKLFAEGINAKR